MTVWSYLYEDWLHTSPRAVHVTVKVQDTGRVFTLIRSTHQPNTLLPVSWHIPRGVTLKAALGRRGRVLGAWAPARREGVKDGANLGQHKQPYSALLWMPFKIVSGLCTFQFNDLRSEQNFILIKYPAGQIHPHEIELLVTKSLELFPIID